MNAAAIFALCNAVLQLGTGLLLVGLARAPGWRAARTFALIALTASAYSAADIFFAMPELGDAPVLWASRLSFFAGSLHCAAWLLYTFGGPTATPRALPSPLKALAGLLTGVGTFILVFGTHELPGVFADTTIPWAGVAYHSPVLRPWAEWYGLVMIGSLLVPFAAFVKRARAGESGAVSHLLGFGVFFACSIGELLVANGVLHTFYLADLGFLAVVVPVAAATVRRVAQDAARLTALSERLAGEVEERTEALDRAQVALLESERHAALGRLAAGVGHEVNNPLTYLSLSLDAVDEWVAEAQIPADVVDALANARDGANRIRLVVDGLRYYTRTTAGENRTLEPADLIGRALSIASHQLQHVAHVRTDISPTLPIYGDEARLVQVLVNLLSNAAEAINEAELAGEVTIAVRARQLTDGTVAIEVIDTGPGITKENLRRLAEPYFTTRSGTGATGLGLYLARGIVEQHGGRLEIESEVGVGTTARAVLPTAPPRPAPPADVVAGPVGSLAPDATQLSSGERPHVLLVDDERTLVNALARSLAPYCDTTVVNSGIDALHKIAEGSSFDAVVCDLIMPGMSGNALADALAATDPALRRRMLFMTGGAVTPAAMAFLERDDVEWVQKPISGRELADVLARLLTRVDVTRT